MVLVAVLQQENFRILTDEANFIDNFVFDNEKLARQNISWVNQFIDCK